MVLFAIGLFVLTPDLSWVGDMPAIVGTGARVFAQQSDTGKQEEGKKKPDKKEPFGIHRLTHDTHLQELGAVSPDGQSMLVVARKNNTAPNIYIMELKGYHAMKQVTNLAAGAANPVWSPAGDSIAFDGVDQTTAFAQISLVNLAAAQARQLTNNNFTNKTPVFSADGKRLFYTTDESPLPDAAFGIWHVASIATTGKSKGEYFTDDETSSVLPKVSPDGKTVLLVKVSESGRHSLWEYGLEGKPHKDLTGDRLARIHSYVINPAGGSIVIWGQEQPERQEDIYILDLKSGGLTPLPDPDLPKRNPAVSPDGKLIAFIGPAGEGNFLFLYDSTTGDIEQLSKKGDNSFTPVFTSNQTILFGSDREAENEGDFNDVYMADLTSRMNSKKK